MTPAVRLLLAVLVTAAAALRFYGLDIQSLWTDELYTYDFSARPTLAAVIREGVIPDVHPPGYQALMYYVQKFIGDSEWALRLPSAIAGVLSVLALFALGRRLYSEAVGLIAAGLLVVSWPALYYSQEARSYALLVLLVILAVRFWLPLRGALLAGQRPRTASAALFVLCAAAAAYTHYFGLLFSALLGAALYLFAVRSPRAFLQASVVNALVLLCYAPWLPYFRQHLNKGGLAWLQQPTYDDLYGLAPYLFNASEALLWWLVVPLLVIAAFSALYRRQPGHSAVSGNVLFLLFWLLVPVAIAFVKSRTGSSVFTMRNLIIVLPAAYLLVARAVTALPTRPLQAIAAGSLVAGMAYAGIVQKDYYGAVKKEQWRESVQYVIDRGGCDPDNLVVAWAWTLPQTNYYFQQLGADCRVQFLAGDAATAERMQRAVQAQNPRRVWHIAALRPLDDTFIRYLSQRFVLQRHKEYYGTFVAELIPRRY